MKLLTLKNTIMKNIAIYNNNGKTIDSITFVFLESKQKSIFSTNYTYECLCTSYNGVSFWQHSNCERGKHLGKKVTFESLDKELQSKFNNYLKD